MGERTDLDTTVHPAMVRRLHLQFNGWLGDDLLETFPCFVVTGRLRERIEQLGFSGCTFDELDATTSLVYEELYPNRKLPLFFWLKVSGEAGRDDFGISDDHYLVVSEKVLKYLRTFNFGNCEIRPFGDLPGSH